MTDTDRHRILLKLETIWLSLPDDGFSTFRHAMEEGINDHPDMLCCLSDTEVEARFDRYIAKQRLSVSGGWKS